MSTERDVWYCPWGWHGWIANNDGTWRCFPRIGLPQMRASHTFPGWFFPSSWSARYPTCRTHFALQRSSAECGS